MVRCSSVRIELMYIGGVIHAVVLVHGESETQYYVFTRTADLISLLQLPEFLQVCLEEFIDGVESAEAGQPSTSAS